MKKIYLIGGMLSLFVILVFVLIIVPIILDSFKKLLLIKKSPDNYYTLGNIQKKLNKFHEAAISFENALKINPNFSEAHNNLGNTKKSMIRQ